MTAIVKVGMVGILGVMLGVQLKAGKPEYGFYVGLALSILFFGFCVGQVETMMQQFEKIGSYLENAKGYLGVLFKVTGITYICEFSAGICKEAGYGAVADQIEILGKLSVIYAGMPILLAVIDELQNLI